jgi:hypothetical protein
LDSGNGAISLLIWTAIQHAAALGLTFNTNGLNSKNSLLLLTGFGGVLKPRHFARKTTEMYQTAQFLKARCTACGRGLVNLGGMRGRPVRSDLTSASAPGGRGWITPWAVGPK